MKRILGALVITAVCAGSATAATIPLQVLASWNNADGGTNVTYSPLAGTSADDVLVSWGIPRTAFGQSSYRFISAFPVEFGAAPIGTEFKIGTFQHNNRAISAGSGIDSVDLGLQLNFDPADTVPGAVDAMTVVFHTETPNESGECPGNPVPCPDLVTFGSGINLTQNFTYLGAKYQLAVLGFATLDNGVLMFDDEFVTQENALNSTDLYAVITPVPEPGTMLLVGAGLLAGAARLRRRQ